MAAFPEASSSPRNRNDRPLTARCVGRQLLLLSRVDAVLGDDHGLVSAFLPGTIVASVAGGNTLSKVRAMRTRLRTPKFSLQLENLRDLAHRIPPLPRRTRDQIELVGTTPLSVRTICAC
jgi:hypothetical protein